MNKRIHIIVIFVSIGLFAALAYYVGSGELPAIDRYVMSRVPRWRREQWEPVARFVSEFGSLENVTVLALPIAGWLAFRQPRQVPFFLLAFVASPLSSFFKDIFNRRRPEEWLLGFEPAISNHLSFPSGHTALSAGVYGFLILLVWRSSSTRAVRLGVSMLIGAAILAVGLSRIYLGVHYPTDVLGSLLLATGWLAIVSQLQAASFDVDTKLDEKKSGA